MQVLKVQLDAQEVRDMMAMRVKPATRDPRDYPDRVVPRESKESLD